MSLIDDFKKYRDQYGLNGLYSDGSTGQVTQNGALFTLEYVICLMGDPNTSDADKQAELARLRLVYNSLETFPGTSSRVPGGTEFDSMDNTGAIFTFSGLYDQGSFSTRSYNQGSSVKCVGIDQTQDQDRNNQYYWVPNMLNFWRGPKWFWNNNAPSLFCFAGWHGRSPGHIAMLKMTAGKWVGPVGQLAVLIGQFVGLFQDKGNADARKLPYADWQYLKTRNFVWKLAYKLWCKVLMKQYPNGMQDVYRLYYGDQNHPMRTYPKTYEQ